DEAEFLKRASNVGDEARASYSEKTELGAQTSVNLGKEDSPRVISEPLDAFSRYPDQPPEQKLFERALLLDLLHDSPVKNIEKLEYADEDRYSFLFEVAATSGGL